MKKSHPEKTSAAKNQKLDKNKTKKKKASKGGEGEQSPFS